MATCQGGCHERRAYLREKGREVASVQPHNSLKDVVARLAEKRVGALVAIGRSTRAPLGIVSERDIIRVLGAHGAAVLDELVSKHMTRKVQTVNEDTSIDEVMSLMTAGRFRHLPVVEEDKVVGIVSIGDVVRRHVDELHHAARGAEGHIASA